MAKKEKQQRTGVSEQAELARAVRELRAEQRDEEAGRQKRRRRWRLLKRDQRERPDQK